jgi:hypothetical protein
LLVVNVAQAAAALAAFMIEEVTQVENELEAAIENSPLPAEPDRAAVDAFIVDTYRESWGW